MKGTSMNDATPDQAVSPAIRAQLAREVLGRYAIACDTGDEAALGALFHPEATAVYDKAADLTGNTPIAAWVIGATAPLVSQPHALGALTVDVARDRSTVIAALPSHTLEASTPAPAMINNRRSEPPLEPS